MRIVPIRQEKEGANNWIEGGYEAGLLVYSTEKAEKVGGWPLLIGVITNWACVYYSCFSFFYGWTHVALNPQVDLKTTKAEGEGLHGHLSCD